MLVRVCVTLDVNPFSVVAPLVVTLSVKAVAVETIVVVPFPVIAISVESWRTKVEDTSTSCKYFLSFQHSGEAWNINAHEEN